MDSLAIGTLTIISWPSQRNSTSQRSLDRTRRTTAHRSANGPSSSRVTSEPGGNGFGAFVWSNRPSSCMRCNLGTTAIGHWRRSSVVTKHVANAVDLEQCGPVILGIEAGEYIPGKQRTLDNGFVATDETLVFLRRAISLETKFMDILHGFPFARLSVNATCQWLVMTLANRVD